MKFAKTREVRHVRHPQNLVFYIHGMGSYALYLN